MIKHGHNDPQFVTVNREPPAGAGPNRPDTVVYQKRINGSKKSMQAHDRLEGQ